MPRRNTVLGQARGLREKNTTITFIRMADRIRFVLNDQPVELDGTSPMTTLLDWLREDRGLRGTKEGCAEGDCGACTVVLERADGRREVINSCIALLGQIDGLSLRTVEGLRRPDGTPHPVQTAMAEADATQCGFCTPGFVMSAYAFAAGGEKPDPETIHDALAGNLCRCTGYRPIVEAMTRIAGLPIEPAATALQRLNRIGEGRRLGIAGDPVDLRARLLECRVECGPKMARLESVERRRLEWRGPRFKKWVRIGRCRGRQGGAAHAPQLGGRAAIRNPTNRQASVASGALDGGDSTGASRRRSRSSRLGSCMVGCMSRMTEVGSGGLATPRLSGSFYAV